MSVKKILAFLSFETSWERETLRGIINYANSHNIQWEIRATPRESVIETLIKQIKPHAILCHPNQAIPQLTNQAKLVYFDTQDTQQCPRLKIDNQSVGELAAEHLLTRNFNQFCFIGNLEKTYSIERLNSFVGKLKQSGFSATAFNTHGRFLSLLNNQDESCESKRLRALLETIPKPIGIFAVDDYEAYTTLKICQQAGWKLPEQIGILGVNNDELVCHACAPMLSSLRIPYEQIGFKAGQLLHQQLEGIAAPQETIMFQPIEIVERHSTATNQVDDPLVEDAVRFIAEHLTETITINDLLKLSGVSRSMLERRFKQSINRTPGWEIQHQRIESAKHYLRDTAIPIHQVANFCGFNSSNRFCQAFKNSTTHTPLSYRRMVR
ncbi:substrate-binding domain-containing protein [Coraliomargarita sp. W4R72]